MSDTQRLDEFDRRLRKQEQVIFNGLRAASTKMSRWLDELAPLLLTREEHAKIDDDRAEASAEVNRATGQRKDRRLVLVGLVIPFLTVGFMKLLEVVPLPH